MGPAFCRPPPPHPPCSFFLPLFLSHPRLHFPRGEIKRRLEARRKPSVVSGGQRGVAAQHQQQPKCIEKGGVHMHNSKIHPQPESIYLPHLSDTQLVQQKNNQHADSPSHSFFIVKRRSTEIPKRAVAACVHTCTHLHTHPDSDLNYSSANCTVSSKVIAD